MKRLIRQKIRFLALGVAMLVMVSCQAAHPLLGTSQEILSTNQPQTQTPELYIASYVALSAAPAQLPPLPYNYAELEPYIDAGTMQIHHDKHHATYVDKLNQALQTNPKLKNKGLENLLQDLDHLPDTIQKTVRNNGGGHLNHTLFWQSMNPHGGSVPTGALAAAIDRSFGSFDAFKAAFEQAGVNHFGSGWVWLVYNSQGQLQITTTSNQDNPIMEGLLPLLGNDIWEHAYYLNYQNRRADYLKNWWSVVDWNEIDRRFAEASSTRSPHPLASKN
jgi:superoxide dismutase, Fe-Mn family